MANETTSEYVTVEINTDITLYASTSNTSDLSPYYDLPSSGTFNSYKLRPTTDTMVFYYKTDGNGKRYIVGSEPKSIRH